MKHEDSVMMRDLHDLHKGIDTEMKVLLKSTPHQMMEWQEQFADDAARRISTMSDNSNRPDTAEVGGIAKLVSFVQSSNAIQKEEAAAVLAHIAQNKRSRVAIAAAGGIEALVALARDGNDIQKANAAHALGSLAFNKANDEAITAGDGIEALVTLARDGNEMQKTKAAGALRTLADDDLGKSVAVAQYEGKYPGLSQPQPSKFPHRPRTTFSGDDDAVSTTGEHGFLYELKSSDQPNSKEASAIPGPSPPKRIGRIPSRSF